METEVIDKLFLELSQFTTAKTKRELELEEALRESVEIIKIWHGPAAWGIYRNRSPEMRRILKALG